MGARALAGGGYNNNGGSTTMRRRLDPMLPQMHYTYAFLPNRVRLLVRHSRYIQHRCNALSKGASKVVECLLLGGRMMAKDAIWGAWGPVRRRRVQSNNGSSSKDNDRIINGKNGKGRDNKVLHSIALMFCKLVEGVYIKMVRPIATNHILDNICKG
jgi:hypothetical protein